MKQKVAQWLFVVLGFFASSAFAQTPDPVEQCSLYGSGFYYVPGTQICIHAMSGDAREQTPNGTWRSRLPYPEGRWVTDPQSDCAPGELREVGRFRSTDFTLNPWEKKQTEPVSFPLPPTQFISKVYMSGGFFDPRLPFRGGGSTGFGGLCLRYIDRSGAPLFPAGTGEATLANLSIGCISNGRILNMPATYAITPTLAYPTNFFNITGPDQFEGPFPFGTHLVVTTDLGTSGANAFVYLNNGVATPMEGQVTVSVCVAQGTKPR